MGGAGELCLGKQRTHPPPPQQAPLAATAGQGFPQDRETQEGKGKRKDPSKLGEGTIAVSQDPSAAGKDK